MQERLRRKVQLTKNKLNNVKQDVEKKTKLLKNAARKTDDRGGVRARYQRKAELERCRRMGREGRKNNPDTGKSTIKPKKNIATKMAFAITKIDFGRDGVWFGLGVVALVGDFFGIMGAGMASFTLALMQPLNLLPVIGTWLIGATGGAFMALGVVTNLFFIIIIETVSIIKNGGIKLTGKYARKKLIAYGLYGFELIGFSFLPGLTTAVIIKYWVYLAEKEESKDNKGYF